MGTLVNHDQLIHTEVRSMKIEDLPSVFHLGEQVFTLRRAPSLYRIWDEYEVVDFYRSDPDSCLVATNAEGKVVGFILGTIIDKRNSPRKYGYLVWLAVDGKARTRGIGTLLFERFKARMRDRDVRMLLVDTEADNEKALSFFKNRGFSAPRNHVYLTLENA